MDTCGGISGQSNPENTIQKIKENQTNLNNENQLDETQKRHSFNFDEIKTQIFQMSVLDKEMCMQVNGLMTKQLDQANILIRMDQHMKESGRITINTVMERNNGQMGHHIQDNMEMERNMAKEYQYFADGSIYDGEFYQNEIHGKGHYFWGDKSDYEGEWSKNKMHGIGIHKWPDGKIYGGEYKNDKKEGQGTFVWPDGRKYIGQWLDGKQHGRGTITKKSGESHQGEWLNGRRVRWIEQEEQQIE